MHVLEREVANGLARGGISGGQGDLGFERQTWQAAQASMNVSNVSKRGRREKISQLRKHGRDKACVGDLDMACAKGRTPESRRRARVHGT